jgi:hypothetical protein
MSLLPKEHGAYGQMAVPLATALAVGGATASGLLTVLAVAAGFLAHEPLQIVLGLRGPRATREQGHRASRWLLCCGAAAVAAGVAAATMAPPAIRWSFALPLVPAAWLAWTMATARDKTWQGEVGAAIAFSLTAVPVCLAGGVAVSTAFAVAIPFVLMFVSGTLAVRTIILRVRGGGDMRATTVIRRSVVTLALAGTVVLATSAAADLLPWTVLLSSAPGLLAAAVIVVVLPPPTRLRTIGWALVGVSLLTAIVVVLTTPRWNESIGGRDESRKESIRTPTAGRMARVPNGTMPRAHL